MSVHSLMLAAGCGSRFGDGLKQLVTICGQSMLERSLAIVQSVMPENVTVVLGYGHEAVQKQIGNVNVIVNPNWQAGLGSSIACGVAHLPSNASAVLICLCDQVAITADDLKRLCDVYEKQTAAGNPMIVCAAYSGIVGVPAIFPAAYFAQLRALTGDKGARQLLLDNPVVTVPLENAAIDIDTRAQWVQFTQVNSVANKGECL